MPISERSLCGVIIIYAHAHKITSLAGFISAVQQYAVSRFHPDLPRHRLFTAVKTGLENWYGDTNICQPKQAITVDDLLAFRRHLKPTNFTHCRNWCACLFAFFGLLRINEYCNGALLVKHVVVERWGVSLIIPYSKTSLIPTEVDIIKRSDVLCPLLAYRAYVSFLPQELRQPGHPFFLQSIDAVAPMTDSSFIANIRALVSSALGRDPAVYAGHSFRRGGTTALLQAGVPEATIASHGRWKSQAYRGYVDVQHNLGMRLAATAQLSLHTRQAATVAHP